MVLASAACATAILAASALTLGSCAWLAAILAIWMACSWWTIINRANITSASLKLPASLDAAADGELLLTAATVDSLVTPQPTMTREQAHAKATMVTGLRVRMGASPTRSICDSR